MKWYEIKAKLGGVAEIWIYDVIGEDFWGEGVSAKDLCKEISALDVSQIDVHINSPGGNVFDGVAIAAALKRHPANVTSYVDGYAASIASIVMLAADRVVAAAGAWVMIHYAWARIAGNAYELREFAELLDRMDTQMVGVYMDKSGMEEEAVRAAMLAETWYSADDALAAGLVDEIAGEVAAAAMARVDFAPLGYKHAPQAPVVPAAVTTAEIRGEGGAPSIASGDEGGAPSDERPEAYVPGLGYCKF